jgi:tetratricopeptide (TPR) repeat protein
MKREIILIIAIALGLGAAAMLTRWIDQNRSTGAQQFAEQQLYLNGSTAKRLTLAFNGLAADWYWMRSLQYVGRKIVAHQDAHDGQFQLTNLSSLDLRLLASLLDVTTTLDPQFITAYEYGAVILPEINPDQAIALLNKGIAANPTSWQLHQHLGYIYWQRKEYQRASEIYAAGASLPGAPPWMTAMSARLKADAGSRNAAREMYQRLFETSRDKTVKDMVTAHLMRLDWLDDRDVIRPALSEFRSRSGRCPMSWLEVAPLLRGTNLRLDSSSGAPLDPSGAAYRLVNNGCDVDLGKGSTVAQ